MSFFRSHIFKVTVLLLVATGMVLFAWPGKNRNHTGESVSAWLIELRSDTVNPAVHDKIYSLRTETGDVSGLLRKASSIISEHSEDFKLPVENSNTSDEDIYNTLLLKWTLHKQGPPVDTVLFTDRRSQVPQASEKNDKSAWKHPVPAICLIVDVYRNVNQIWDEIRIIPNPLASSIAINAP